MRLFARLLLTVGALISFLSAPLWDRSTPLIALANEGYPADTQNNACFSLDVVFLIDQSGSMSGSSGVLAADPLKNRQYAVHTVIDQLAGLALDQCPDSVHRIAVISYGTEAQLDLPLSNIAPESFDEAQNITSNLQGKVLALDLGQTQPHLAFEMAATVFGDAGDPGDRNPRKKVIIFITDGVPYPGNILEYTKSMSSQINENFPFSPVLLEQEKCVDSLYTQYGQLKDIPPEEISECLSTYRTSEEDLANSTYLWMILFKSTEAYPRGLLEKYDELARSHAGQLVQLQRNAQDIPSTFRYILGRLSGVQTSLLRCGDFAVNPYLRNATVIIFKLNPELKVELSYQDANNKLHRIVGGEPDPGSSFIVEEYKEYGANERYRFAYPYPGIWNLYADDCAGLDAYYEDISIDVNTDSNQWTANPIAQFDREPYYNENAPVYFQFRMIDQLTADNSVPQADHPRFHANIALIITDPAGKQWPMPVVYDSETLTFQTKDPLPVPLPGTYKIEFSGSTYIREGEVAGIEGTYDEIFSTERPLFSGAAEYSVFLVTPFETSILSPETNAVLSPIHETIQSGWPLVVTPIEVRAQILDVNGNPLPPDALDDPANALTAVITDKEGNSTAQMIMVPDVSQSGQYTAIFEEYDSSGELTLTVDFKNGYTDEYRPLNERAQRVFQRTDGRWNQAQTYINILIAAIILLILFVLYQVWIRRNKVRGTLYFISQTENKVVTSIGLYTGFHRSKISKPFTEADYLGLKRVDAWFVGKPSKPDASTDSSDFSSLDSLGGSAPSVSIKLKCWPEHGRSFTLTLVPGSQIPYSEGIPFDMMYKLEE